MRNQLLDTPEATTILDEEVLPYDDSGANENNKTHIVNPTENRHIWRWGMTAQDIVDVARTNGWPVKTLCGDQFTPVKNPEKYPMCQPCIDKAGEIMQESGE